jgi:hypothetical protein
MLFDHFSKAMYAAAPDVKDEHCGWCHFVEYEEYITALEFCDSDAIGAFKVYRHPSRRIAALEAEVVKLREVATKAAEKRFCEAIIATQEISKTNGHLTCDVALLLAYYNDHKPKN